MVREVINNNLSITILPNDNNVYIHFKKHQPIIISSDDKYRKGVELDVCSRCKVLAKIFSDEYINGVKVRLCVDCEFDRIQKAYNVEVKE